MCGEFWQRTWVESRERVGTKGSGHREGAPCIQRVLRGDHPLASRGWPIVSAFGPAQGIETRQRYNSVDMYDA